MAKAKIDCLVLTGLVANAVFSQKIARSHTIHVAPGNALSAPGHFAAKEHTQKDLKIAATATETRDLQVMDATVMKTEAGRITANKKMEDTVEGRHRPTLEYFGFFSLRRFSPKWAHPFVLFCETFCAIQYI